MIENCFEDGLLPGLCLLLEVLELRYVLQRFVESSVANIIEGIEALLESLDLSRVIEPKVLLLSDVL